MIAERQLWTPTSRLYNRTDEGQPRRFVLDCGIAWQNYRDDAGVFQEIDLTPEVVAGGLRIRKVPYDLTLLTTGERRVAPDRAFAATRFIRFPANRFLANKTFIRVGNSLVWQSAAYNIVLRWLNSRVKFDVVLKRPVPFDSVSFDVDKAGIDDATLLSYLANLKAIDSSQPFPVERKLSVSLVAGVLTLGFDLAGMTFPVTIDPTLDIAVAAGADDSRIIGTNWSATSTLCNCGLNAASEEVSCQMRFTNVTVPSGATIDVCYATLIAAISNSATTVNTNLAFEAADSPGQVTDLTDFNGRSLTSVAAWDSIAAWTAGDSKQTPSIVTPQQEVINRAGWASGNAQNLFWKNDGSTAGAFRQVASYDHATYTEPSLHIEYTAGAAWNLERIERRYPRGVGRGVLRGVA